MKITYWGYISKTLRLPDLFYFRKMFCSTVILLRNVNVTFKGFFGYWFHEYRSGYLIFLFFPPFYFQEHYNIKNWRKSGFLCEISFHLILLYEHNTIASLNMKTNKIPSTHSHSFFHTHTYIIIFSYFRIEKKRKIIFFRYKNIWKFMPEILYD